MEAVEGDDWLTRPRFVIHYWRDGEVVRRNVMMASGLLSYGERECERATASFRERAVAVERVEPRDSTG